MTDINDEAARNSRFKSQADKHFVEWLQQPLVKVTMSQMPPGENRELLRELLRSAFDAGNGCGQAIMVIELLMKTMEGERRK